MSTVVTEYRLLKLITHHFRRSAYRLARKKMRLALFTGTRNNEATHALHYRYALLRPTAPPKKMVDEIEASIRHHNACPPQPHYRQQCIDAPRLPSSSKGCVHNHRWKG